MANPSQPNWPDQRQDVRRESGAVVLDCVGPEYYSALDHPRVDNVSVVTVKLAKNLSFEGCYAWYADVFSTASPYVAMYTPDDMNNLKHAILRVDSKKNEPGE